MPSSSNELLNDHDKEEFPSSFKSMSDFLRALQSNPPQNPPHRPVFRPSNLVNNTAVAQVAPMSSNPNTARAWFQSGMPYQSPQSPPVTPPVSPSHPYQVRQLYNGSYVVQRNNGGFVDQRTSGIYTPQRTATVYTNTGTSYAQKPFTPHVRNTMQLLTPDSITTEHITSRIESLLSEPLRWQPHQINQLAVRYTKMVVDLGVNGHLGPLGLSSVTDIINVVGHEDTKKYYALAVMSPSPLRILLKGDAVDTDGADPLHDDTAGNLVVNAFRASALKEWERMEQDKRWRERRT